MLLKKRLTWRQPVFRCREVFDPLRAARIAETSKKLAGLLAATQMMHGCLRATKSHEDNRNINIEYYVS
jgi:hypothetical protein